MTLSVCVMSCGKNLSRLAAILDLLRPVSSEIVVAIDDRRPEGAAEIFARRADKLLFFPFEDPGDRPIPWLFHQCTGDWILNVDDDEVPSGALLDELPQLIERKDFTHAWIARKWLYPDTQRFLTGRPWSTEYQLRLLLNDPRNLQFSDEFHRPVICSGPMCFVEAPLWHLDTAVNDRERRTAKALEYERARRGMRIGSLSHNTGFYVPELSADMRTAPVPDADIPLIKAVCAGAGVSPGGPMHAERASRAEVDGYWPGSPLTSDLHRGRVSLVGEQPSSFVSGVQETVVVRIENLSGSTWPWGEDSAPDIRLAACWEGDDGRALRTSLPAAVRPGDVLVVPAHVMPPSSPGRYRLELDLVHEHVCWFGCGVSFEVEVRARRRVAVTGDSFGVCEALDLLALDPEIEPFVLEPGEPLEARFGQPRMRGLRPFLLDGTSRAAAVARSARVLAAARTGHGVDAATRRSLRMLASCELLVVSGPDWEADARPKREAFRLATTILAARASSTPVAVIRGTSLPDGVARLGSWQIDLSELPALLARNSPQLRGVARSEPLRRPAHRLDQPAAEREQQQADREENEHQVPVHAYETAEPAGIFRRG